MSDLLTDEWFWAAVICVVPFLAFGAFELVAIYRRRRAEAIARRSKSELRGPAR